MPIIHSLTGMMFADLKTGPNGAVSLQSVPAGFLNSRETFLHVLSARWGELADYHKAPDPIRSQPDNIDTQWEDATNLMREAIGSGKLEPNVALDGSLLRIAREQWPSTNKDWWESTFFLAQPAFPIPVSMAKFRDGVICFEVSKFLDWLAGLSLHAEAGTATLQNRNLEQTSSVRPISKAVLRRAYQARLADADKDNVKYSREDDRNWAKSLVSNCGRRVSIKVVDEIRKEVLPQERQKGGRPGR